MKKRVISISIAIITLSVISYFGIKNSEKIAQVELEYYQTGIEALKNVIKNYYTIMYSQILYSFILGRVLMKIDSVYISRYVVLAKGKAIVYWIVFAVEILIFMSASQLLHMDPYVYSPIILMLIFGLTGFDSLFINRLITVSKQSELESY